MVSMLSAGDVGEETFNVGLRLSGYTRIKTPIGTLLYGGRSGMGHGWYWYSSNPGEHVKSFGRRQDAVDFVELELARAGVFVTDRLAHMKPR